MAHVFALLVPVLLSLAIHHHHFTIDTLFPLPDLQSVFPYEDDVWTVASSGPSKEKASIVPWRLNVSDANLEDFEGPLAKNALWHCNGRSKFCTWLYSRSIEKG